MGKQRKTLKRNGSRSKPKLTQVRRCRPCACVHSHEACPWFVAVPLTDDEIAEKEMLAKQVRLRPLPPFASRLMSHVM